MRGKVRPSQLLVFAVSLLLSAQSCSGVLSLDTLFNKTSMETRTSESLSSSNASRSVFSASGAYRVIAIADAHVAGASWPDGEKLVSWIAENAVAAVPVRALILAGDLTDSAEESQYAAVKKVLDAVAALSVAVIPAIGNHDLYTSEGWTLWKKYIGSGSSWYPSVGSLRLLNSSASETLRCRDPGFGGVCGGICPTLLPESDARRVGPEYRRHARPVGARRRLQYLVP